MLLGLLNATACAVGVACHDCHLEPDVAPPIDRTDELVTVKVVGMLMSTQAMSSPPLVVPLLVTLRLTVDEAPAMRVRGEAVIVAWRAARAIVGVISRAHIAARTRPRHRRVMPRTSAGSIWRGPALREVARRRPSQCR